MTTGPRDINTKPPPNGDEMDAQVFLAHLIFDPLSQPEGCYTAAYLAEIETMEMDEAQKRELIHMLWQLIQSVFQIRLGLDPVSDALAAKEIDCHGSQTSMVISDHKHETAFNAASEEGAPR